LKQIRRHLTYANVMSSIAVFLMLGGATAFAATKIGANELKGNSVKTGKIVKEAVTAGKIKKGAIDETKIAKDAVTGEKVKDGSLTGSDINLGTLGTVPNAANAAKLGGQSPSAFQSRVRWVLVAADGTIIRQSGGITSSGSGGIYELNFGADVSNSAILADEIDNGTTAGTTAVMSCVDSGKAGFGNCSGASVGNPNFVKVATTNAAEIGVSAQAFYLAVIG
jgi:hypothetical protein